ncbi:MAG: hypothetical protein LBU27_07930 [Candidatus Peribacteria bacterium]|jgi:hypothetical protein|nr:hypothetical protein [Candidatus Peribacteria bacterium]
MEKFYSKESKESEEKNCMKNVSFIDRENRTPQKWAIEDIKTIPMEKLQNIKTVEFITHPLYKFLYETFREPSTCKQENLIQLINDENISFEEIFLTYLNQLLEQGKQRDTSKFFLSNEFLKIMESLEEISNYRKIDSTKLKIFCLPNILDDLNPTQITLINKFLKQYNHENIYTLNTEQATN